jgi:hypothetical protein
LNIRMSRVAVTTVQPPRVSALTGEIIDIVV